MTAGVIAASYVDTVARATYAEEVLADAPLAYYRLGEPSGTTMVDASGNGRNGTIDAGVALGATGLLYGDSNPAWTVDAAEGGEVAAASWMAPATALTAEAWVYLTAYDADGSIVMARSQVGASNSRAAKAWSLHVNGSGALTGRIYNDAGVTVAPVSAAGVVPLNTPCQVVLVQNGTNVLFYVNGGLVSSTALTGTPVSFANNTQPLTVGRTQGTSVANYTISGRIDEAAFYGTALSHARIQAHYRAGLPALDAYAAAVLADSPIAYYRIGELSGTTMLDSSGNGRHGTYTAMTVGTPGLLTGNADTAGTFSGSGYGDVPHDASWMQPIAVTLEAWVRPTGGTGTRMILGRANLGTTTDDNAYHSYLYLSGTARLGFGRKTVGSAVYDRLDPATITLGLRYHLVGTYDGTWSRLYVNGVEVESVASSANPGPLVSGGTNPLRVGAVNFTGSRFVGVGDEFAMYAYALTPERVAAHYAAGTGT